MTAPRIPRKKKSRLQTRAKVKQKLESPTRPGVREQLPPIEIVDMTFPPGSFAAPKHFDIDSAPLAPKRSFGQWLRDFFTGKP